MPQCIDEPFPVSGRPGGGVRGRRKDGGGRSSRREPGGGDWGINGERRPKRHRLARLQLDRDCPKAVQVLDAVEPAGILLAVPEVPPPSGLVDVVVPGRFGRPVHEQVPRR